MSLRVTVLAILVVVQYFAASAVGHTAEQHAVPVGVKRVLVDPVSNSPVVILEGLQKNAIVPIWIGPSEAASIAMELEQRKLPRPNSHDLIQSLLSALEAKLDRVTITELRENTYFAVMTVKLGDREIHIDARPSDAIAVALRAVAPIYAAPEILERSSRSPEHASAPGTTAARHIMGFHVQDMTAELAGLLNSRTTGGVLVAHVESNSLASRVGFQRGDVITGVDQKNIRNSGELEQAFVLPKGQKRLNVRVQRQGKPITIVIDLPL